MILIYLSTLVAGILIGSPVAGLPLYTRIRENGNLKKEKQMKIVILTLALLLPVMVAAEELVFDQDWHLKYRAEEGRIYDQNWQLKGYLQDGRIYDNNWHLKGRIEEGKLYDRIYDPTYHLEGYRQGNRLYGPTWTLKGYIKGTPPGFGEK